MLQLRRCKTAIINIDFRAALENLLSQLLKRPNDFHSNVRDQAEALALSWFTDQEARKKYQGCSSSLDLRNLQLKRKQSGDPCPSSSRLRDC
jgi:hypothetical protein